MILKKLPGYPNCHEYLRETLESKYIECFSCKRSSLFACIRCKLLLELSLEKEKEELEMNPQIMLIAV